MGKLYPLELSEDVSTVTQGEGVEKIVQLPTAQIVMIVLVVMLPNMQNGSWLSGPRSSVPPVDVGDH